MQDETKTDQERSPAGFDWSPRPNGDSSLLLDMSESHPCLRTYLLGEKQGDRILLPGRLTVERTGFDIAVRLHAPQFGSVATLLGRSLFGLLESIENSLATDSMPWLQDWKSRQALERKHSLGGGGS